MTSSTRYFVEAGRIKPETRFTAIRSNPAAKIPRRGLISAHTWGRFFHAFVVFLSLEPARASFSVGISAGRQKPSFLDVRARGLVIWRIGCHRPSIGASSRTRGRSCHRTFEIQHGRNKFAHGNSKVSPEAALQAGVILAAAEEVAN